MTKKSIAKRRRMGGAGAQGRSSGVSPRPAIRGQGHRRGGRRSRRPWGIISGAVGAVALFLIVVIALEINLNGSLRQDTKVLPAPASLINSLTNTPLKILEAVKAGSISHPPVNIPASYKPVALTSHGLPEVAYVGAEFCPYCALERWSLIVGLSRFGKWTNLHLIRSSVYETGVANIPTFTFAYGAAFTSPYLVFLPREYQSNVSLHDNGPPYATFQSLPATVATAFSSIAGGSYPFIDYAGVVTQVGSEAPVSDVAALQGLSWSQVVRELRNPASVAAQEVLGGANYVTAATCLVTGQTPGAVCKNSTIQSLEAQVKRSS